MDGCPSNQEQVLHLHIRQDRGEGRVPVSFVAQALQSLQLALYQVGEYLLGRGGKERGAYSSEVTEQCRLEIGEVAAGSFRGQLLLTRRRQMPLMTAVGEELGGRAVDVLMTSLKAIEERDFEEFSRQLVDPTVRRRLLQYVSGMLASPAEPFVIELEDGRARTVRLDRNVRQTVATWTEYKPTQEVTVEGQLVELRIVPRLHFRVRSVDDDRLIEADFEEGLEPALIAYMGRMVRVRGVARLDRQGRVQRLTDVAHVEPVDIDYLPVHEARSDQRRLRFIRPLQALKTKEDGLVVIRIPELGVHEYGETVEEALQALNDELLFLWEEYAQAPDETLTLDAMRLKERLRSVAYPVPAERS